jgi:hypothetical protein
MAPEWTRPPSFFAGWLWGVSASPFLNSPWIYGLKDNTLAWCDWGPFMGELYDVRAACYEAWMLKASRVSSQEKRRRLGPLDVTFSTYESCMAQARRFAPFGFA